MTFELINWALLGLCLVLSFLLSGMEAGVFALSRLRIRQQMRAGRGSARQLHTYLEHPENFLWTILVGNTLVNLYVLGWLIPLVHERLAGRPGFFIAALAVMVFLLFALLDLLPKMLFRTYPNRLCMYFARPFRFVHLLLQPFVALVEWFAAFLLRWTGGHVFTGRLFGNRDELRQLMQDSGQALSSEERMMINHVLDLQSLTVRQIAIPMAQVASVETDTPLSDVLAIARERNIARMPVWQVRDGQRRVAGLVALRPILYQAVADLSKPAGEFVRPALYLEEDMRLEVALGRMQRGGQRLAVVLGRDGRESGVVSLRDILKVVFGEVNL